MLEQQEPQYQLQAIVRQPGGNLAQATTATGTLDQTRATEQHNTLCHALQQCGVKLTTLHADPLFPTGCFIGDTAVVTETVAIICNFKNTDPRQGMQKNAASILAGTKFLKFITAPGILDARDVFRMGQHFYIGLSQNTDQEGAAQLAFFLKEFGYNATVLDLREDNFHLRTAIVRLDKNRILLREELTKHYAFMSYDKIYAAKNEIGATNAIMVNNTLILPTGCSQTRQEIRLLDIPVIEVDVSEFEKLDGGLIALILPLPTKQKPVATLTTDTQARA